MCVGHLQLILELQYKYVSGNISKWRELTLLITVLVVSQEVQLHSVIIRPALQLIVELEPT